MRFGCPPPKLSVWMKGAKGTEDPRRAAWEIMTRSSEWRMLGPWPGSTQGIPLKHVYKAGIVSLITQCDALGYLRHGAPSASSNLRGRQLLLRSPKPGHVFMPRVGDLRSLKPGWVAESQSWKKGMGMTLVSS